MASWPGYNATCQCSALTRQSCPFPAMGAFNRTWPGKGAENIPVYYRHKADGFGQNGNGFYKHLSSHRPLDGTPYLKGNMRCGLYLWGCRAHFSGPGEIISIGVSVSASPGQSTFTQPLGAFPFQYGWCHRQLLRARSAAKNKSKASLLCRCANPLPASPWRKETCQLSPRPNYETPRKAGSLALQF